MHSYRIPKPDPKPQRIKLNSKDYSELRKKVWKKQNGLCAECGQWVKLDGDTIFNTAHLAHIKSRGSGGSDVESNVRILCPFCHLQIEHGPQWSKKSESCL
jgi:5-methylcytosine-specific restriction endonuclease McrA